MISTRAPTWLRRALSRATRTLTASMSPASTGRRDSEHAGPGADIKNTARAMSIENAVECQETAARRAVVPGTEGECRLDLDADPIWWNAVAVVCAVDHKASGRDRRQPLEAVGHPI